MKHNRFIKALISINFSLVKASDGLSYVVPVPARGQVKAPFSKLERRVDNARPQVPDNVVVGGF